MTRRGWIALIAAAVLVAAFAYQNRLERAALGIGPLHFHAASLVVIILAAFLLGMGAMFLLSLPVDRRTRDLLRAHGLLHAAPPSRTQVPAERPSPAHTQTDPPHANS
ncbi:MAG TPA: LapA family protein [Longimicrobium sp.]|nr:LapA family protein [Longimicrobium sp.]